jgi:phosphate-selective porin OprO and OprP
VLVKRISGLLGLAALAMASVAVAEEPTSPQPPDAVEVSTPDPAPPPAKPAISYEPGRGAVFRTPDDMFEASLGFNLQMRYTHFDFDAASTGVDTNEFRVRRFKLFMNGFALDPRLTWRFQADFAAPSARIFDDGWLNWKFSDAVSVQGGQYKTPFSRQELFNDGVIQFPERSLATDAFKPSRDIGVMAAGSLGEGVFGYQAGVFGGGGQNTLRVDSHVMPVARLVWNAIGAMGNTEMDLQDHQTPALSVGVDGFLNNIHKTAANAIDVLVLNYTGAAGWLGRNLPAFETDDEIEIRSWELESQFKWRGLSLQGEYYVGQAKGSVSGARVYAYGWYAQAGYFILPKRLDLAARYSFVDYNRSLSNDGVSVINSAATWYFRGNNLKLVIDYSRTHRQRAGLAPANDQAIVVQAQLMP